MPTDDTKTERQREIERLMASEKAAREAGRMEEFRQHYQKRLALQREEFNAQVKQTLGTISSATKVAGQQAWSGVKTAGGALDKAFSSKWCKDNFPAVSLAWLLLKGVGMVATKIGQAIAPHVPGAIQATSSALSAVGTGLRTAASSVVTGARSFEPTKAWNLVKEAASSVGKAAREASDYAYARAAIMRSGGTTPSTTEKYSQAAGPGATKGLASPPDAPTAPETKKPGLS
jgi:hypothetical protein